MTDTDDPTDQALLAARLAAVERALTDRDCDCAHDAFEPPTPTPTGTGDPNGTTLHAAVRALCEYVLTRERERESADDRAAAVAAALENLPDTDGEAGGTERSSADPSPGQSPEPSPATPRDWLERVTAATFE